MPHHEKMTVLQRSQEVFLSLDEYVRIVHVCQEKSDHDIWRLMVVQMCYSPVINPRINWELASTTEILLNGVSLSHTAGNYH